VGETSCVLSAVVLQYLYMLQERSPSFQRSTIALVGASPLSPSPSPSLPSSASAAPSADSSASASFGDELYLPWLPLLLALTFTAREATEAAATTVQSSGSGEEKQDGGQGGSQSWTGLLVQVALRALGARHRLPALMRDSGRGPTETGTHGWASYFSLLLFYSFFSFLLFSSFLLLRTLFNMLQAVPCVFPSSAFPPSHPCVQTTKLS